MTKKISFLLILIFSCGLFAASSNLDSAFKSYQSGDLESSKKALEQTLQTQPSNSNLIYNLGLTEYKLGKVGMAIALWRKALAISPNIFAARNAIHFALEQMPNKPLASNTESSSAWIEKIITNRVSLNMLWPLALVFLVLFLKLMFRFLAAKKRAFAEDQSAPSIPNKLIFYAICSLTLILVTAINISDKLQTKATVVVAQAQAKTGPANENAALFDLPEGTELLIYQKNGSWYKIADPTGREGWVSADQVYVTSEKFL